MCAFIIFLCYLCTLCVPSVLWYCWLGLLTCKTVSRITYTALVETLNTAQSISQSTIEHHHSEVEFFIFCNSIDVCGMMSICYSTFVNVCLLQLRLFLDARCRHCFGCRAANHSITVSSHKDAVVWDVASAFWYPLSASTSLTHQPPPPCLACFILQTVFAALPWHHCVLVWNVIYVNCQVEKSLPN